MNTTPKVSIVIPAYNRERYIGMAVRSVLDQTYRDLECIIIDDGSTDATLEIAEQFAREDDRVLVLSDPVNRGAAWALKTGFEAARGEYLGQVDSDDLLEGSALEKTVVVLESSPDCGLVYTYYQDIDEYGAILSPGWRCSYEYSPWLILSVFMLFHFRLFRKSVYEQAGGIDTDFNLIEDYELCMRMSEVAKNIVNIPEFLYFYRNHSSNVHANNRLAIVELTRAAIESALVRRGLSETHWLDVRYNPQYLIKEKISLTEAN